MLKIQPRNQEKISLGSCKLIIDKSGAVLNLIYRYTGNNVINAQQSSLLGPL